MRLKPLGERILVRRERVDSTTTGGLIVPENARKKKPNDGVVVDVSERVGHISPGDRVVFARHAGQEVEIDGVPHLLMDSDEVEAVVAED